MLEQVHVEEHHHYDDEPHGASIEPIVAKEMVPVTNFNGPDGYKAQFRSYNQFLQPGAPVNAFGDQSHSEQLLPNNPIAMGGYPHVAFQPQTQYGYYDP